MQFPMEIWFIGVAVYHSTITFPPSAPCLLPVGWLTPSSTGMPKSEKPAGSGKCLGEAGAGHGGGEASSVSLEWEAGRSGALISCGQAPRGGAGGHLGGTQPRGDPQHSQEGIGCRALFGGFVHSFSWHLTKPLPADAVFVADVLLAKVSRKPSLGNRGHAPPGRAASQRS